MVKKWRSNLFFPIAPSFNPTWKHNHKAPKWLAPKRALPVVYGLFLGVQTTKRSVLQNIYIYIYIDQWLRWHVNRRVWTLFTITLSAVSTLRSHGKLQIACDMCQDYPIIVGHPGIHLYGGRWGGATDWKQFISTGQKNWIKVITKYTLHCFTDPLECKNTTPRVRWTHHHTADCAERRKAHYSCIETEHKFGMNIPAETCLNRSRNWVSKSATRNGLHTRDDIWK